MLRASSSLLVRSWSRCVAGERLQGEAREQERPLHALELVDELLDLEVAARDLQRERHHVQRRGCGASAGAAAVPVAWCRRAGVAVASVVDRGERPRPPGPSTARPACPASSTTTETPTFLPAAVRSRIKVGSAGLSGICLPSTASSAFCLRQVERLRLELVQLLHECVVASPAACRVLRRAPLRHSASATRAGTSSPRGCRRSTPPSAATISWSWTSQLPAFSV